MAESITKLVQELQSNGTNPLDVSRLLGKNAIVAPLTPPRRLIELSPYSPSNRFFLGHIAALIPALKAHALSLGLATPCHGIGGGITLALEMLKFSRGRRTIAPLVART